MLTIIFNLFFLFRAHCRIKSQIYLEACTLGNCARIKGVAHPRNGRQTNNMTLTTTTTINHIHVDAKRKRTMTKINKDMLRRCVH